MIKTALSLLAIFLMCTPSFAQQDLQVIQIGPFGTLLMVQDVGGAFTIPIKIYSSRDVDNYIPDVTRPGWIQWNIDDFRTQNVYSTYLYSHYKTTAICEEAAKEKGRPDLISDCSIFRYRRRLIKVDVRQNTFTILDDLVLDNTGYFNGNANYGRFNDTFSLSDKRVATMAVAINHITAIIEKEIKQAGNRLTAQEVMRWNAVVSFHNIPGAQHTAQWQCEDGCLHLPGARPGPAFDACMARCRQKD